jgi:hypothetical protein
VLFFFESLLVCLQGALDSAARFLHVSYGLQGTPRRANWGRAKWRKDLDSSAAPSSDFDNDRLRRLDVLVGELRNAIHGEVLSHELKHAGAPGEDPTFMGYMSAGIALEPKLAEMVSEAGRAEEGPARWLPETFSDGVGLIDPWAYSEAALGSVAVALQSVIVAVNARSYAQVEVAPQSEAIWIGTEARRANALMLFGVGMRSNR